MYGLKVLKERVNNMSRVYWVLHGNRCGIGIEIIDKEERLCRLGSSLCSGTKYRRNGQVIRLGLQPE